MQNISEELHKRLNKILGQVFLTVEIFFNERFYSVSIDLFKVNNGDVRTISEICSKMTIKIAEQRQ